MQAKLAQAQDATKRVAPVEAAYGEKLAALLDDSNPYVRQEALLRLLERPQLLPASHLGPVFDLLKDHEQLLNERCLRLLAAGESFAQGIIYEQAQCHYALEHDDLSNARLAGKLLEQIPCEARNPVIISRTLAKPEQAEHLASYFCVTAGEGASLPPLAKSNAPKVQAGLLRLALAVKGAINVEVPVLSSLLDSSEPSVRMRAALVTVAKYPERGDTPGAQAVREKAVALLQSAIVDPSSPIPELVYLHDAGAPFIPALQTRLRRKPEAVVEVLGALAEIGEPAASAALPLIARELGPKGTDPHLALSVLPGFGKGARSAKPEILRYASHHPSDLAAVAAALDGIGAVLTPAEWPNIDRPYRRQCANAGSMPFFDLNLDAECAELDTPLEHLAQRSGVRFRAAGVD